MNPLFSAIAFLTKFPVPPLQHSALDWQKSVAYYPFVGFLLGLFLWVSAEGFIYLFPSSIAAMLTLVAWVFVTGGLHLDGWMDLADGLGSYRSKEDMMRIMKDSRVGAMGVLAAVLLLLVKGTAVYELSQTAPLSWFILPPLAARFALIGAIWFWPYISVNGLGTGMRQGLTRRKLMLGIAFTIIAVYLIQGKTGLFVLFLACLSGAWFIQRVCKRLGGLTGDGYGALVEWVEVCYLLLSLLAGRWLL